MLPPQNEGMATSRRALDIASYQTMIRWREVKEGNPDLSIVYVKATEGLSYRNPLRNDQTKGARNVGLPVGCYHYARPGIGTGAAQADYFLRWQPWGANLIPMLDLEWNEYNLNGPPLVKWTIDFCKRIRAKTGQYPILYTYPAFWESQVISKGGLNKASVAFFSRNIDLWIAHYDTEKPRIPPPWTHYTLWQYTSKRRRPGIPSRVDDSYMACTVNRLRKKKFTAPVRRLTYRRGKDDD